MFVFFDKLRARAGTMGCDALVIGGPTSGPGFSLDLKKTATVRGMTATCIVYTAPPEPIARPPIAPPPVAAATASDSSETP